MNVEFVNPFLEAVANVLSTMAGTAASPGRPLLKKDQQALGDVTGMIGLAGERSRGSLAITFSEPAIIRIASIMLGEEMKGLDDTVADVVGEITNMVTGGAKRILSERGYRFEMAIPSTIMGRNHAIYHKTNGPVIVVPFQMEGGRFFVELCFEDENHH